MNKLSIRISLLLVLLSVSVLAIATWTIMKLTHYHFVMFEQESNIIQLQMEMLHSHLEEGIMESIWWISSGAILIAVLLSVYLGMRITKPLIEMKQTAVMLTRGNFQQRVNVRGWDELSALGHSINSLASRLQDQEKLRQTLTENISHELRTPLTTLKSQLSAIRDGIFPANPEKIQSCLEEINRLSTLVEGLEQLHQNSENPDLINPNKPIRIHGTIHRAVQLYQAAYIQNGISLILETMPDVCVTADHNQLMQIWSNLLSNGLKFTPSGGTVRIKGRVRRQVVEIRIANTGTGIPDEELPYIFNRFYRVDPSRSRKTGGNGLGLSIVKSIVDSFGGHVWAENKEGTIIVVQLPIYISST